MIRAAVVRFPGSNCDEDTVRAMRDVGADAYIVWHRDRDLRGADVVFLPGGFSYGDHLRAGAIARFSPIMDPVQRHAAAGGAVVGICNGFQILCEAGLLPGALARNERLTFASTPVDVEILRRDTVCTVDFAPGDVVRVPVAHGEGRFVADADTVALLEAEGRVVMRYLDRNPNGSLNDIAGICDPAGRIVGFMPHPERVANPLTTSGVGARFFTSIIHALAPAGTLPTSHAVRTRAS